MNTKIYINSAKIPENAGILHRPRIESLFRNGITHPVVTVTAGSGYGKTQAVSDLLNQSDMNSFWVNLCELDNLTSRFWDVISYVISKKNPAAGEKIHNIGFPDSSKTLYETIAFLEQAAASVKEPIIFVFDDFHLIYENVIIEFLSKIILAEINNLTIIFLSREPVKLALGQKFSKENIYNISQDELKFNIEEMTAYLKQNHVTINQDSAKKILETTEGWPLIISLSVRNQLTLQDLASGGQVMKKTSVSDLFEHEIYLNFPERIRYLFVLLSVFEYFPTGILKAAAGDDYEIIKKQIETCMFIRYDEKLDLYLFHSLFREFLVHKQNILNQADIHELILLSGNWLENNEQINTAIQSYHKNGEYKKAWESLKKYDLNCTHADSKYFLKLISEFPDTLIQTDPLIYAVKARLLLNLGNLKESKEFCEYIIHTILQDRTKNKSTVGEIYILLGWILMIERNHDYVEYFKKAADLLPDGSIFVSKKQLINKFNYCISASSYEYGEVKKNIDSIFSGIPYFSKITGGSGYGSEYCVISESAYYTFDIEKAADNAYEAIYRSREKEQYDTACLAYFVLIRCCICTGDFDNVKTLLEDIREYIKLSSLNECTIYLNIIEGWISSRAGQHDLIADWILTENTDAQPFALYLEGRERFVRAYSYLEKGSYRELSSYSDVLYDLYYQKMLIIPQIQIQIFKAVALYHLNDMKKAVSSLERAYEYSYKNEIYMPFIECGIHMEHLIKAVQEYGTKIPSQWCEYIIKHSENYSSQLKELKQVWKQLNLKR